MKTITLSTLAVLLLCATAAFADPDQADKGKGKPDSSRPMVTSRSAPQGARSEARPAARTESRPSANFDRSPRDTGSRPSYADRDAAISARSRATERPRYTDLRGYNRRTPGERPTPSYERPTPERPSSNREQPASPRPGYERERPAPQPSRPTFADSPRRPFAERSSGNIYERRSAESDSDRPADRPQAERRSSIGDRPSPYQRPAPREDSRRPQSGLISRPGPRPEDNRPAPAVSRPEPARNAFRSRPDAQAGRTPERLQSWLREHNSAPARARPGHDVIGNPLPSGARTLAYDSLRRLSPHHRIWEQCGPPRHTYTVLPRTHLYPSYYTERDGHSAYRRYRHHDVVVISFYYPYYYSDPGWFAFYHPGYYPSVFAFYGFCPPWVYRDRCYYDPYYSAPRVTYYEPLDRRGVDETLRDLEDAWRLGDMDLMARHLDDSLDIRVSFNGKYAYTTSTDDFYAMQADVLGTSRTVSMRFDEPVWMSSHDVAVNARQVFEDPDGGQNTVYVQYRLQKRGPDWFIAGFGSSPDPLPRPVTSFRYR